MMQETKPLNFAATHRDFATTLNKRVGDYFKVNGIQRHANSEMVIKTIFMFTIYLLPYVLVVTGVITGT